MEPRELVLSFALAQLRSLSICSLRAHSDKGRKPRKHFVCAVSRVYVKVVAAYCDLVVSEPSSAVPHTLRWTSCLVLSTGKGMIYVHTKKAVLL